MPHEIAMLERLIFFTNSFDTTGGVFDIKGGVRYTGRGDAWDVDDATSGWINPLLAYRFSPEISLYTSFRAMNTRSDYPGKTYFGMNAYNDQGVLEYHTDVVQIKIGRDYLQIGPGDGGQLLLSGSSPAFDQYRVDLTHTFLRFSFWGISLNKREEMARFMNGHRISLRLPGRVELGLNEMVIYGGEQEHWRTPYMNPVLLYHGYGLNVKDEINTLLSVDVDWQALRSLRCWGELLVDDWQTERSKPSELEPPEVGVVVGLNWSGLPRYIGGDITAEYAQVTHRTYNAPRNDWERYLHQNMPTGYYVPAGNSGASNDFKRCSASWSRWWNTTLATTLRYTYLLRGEGTIQGVFNKDYMNYTVAEGYDENIPFGILETTHSITLASEIFISSLLYASPYITFMAVHNPRNQRDARDEQRVSAGVSLMCEYRLLP